MQDDPVGSNCLRDAGLLPFVFQAGLFGVQEVQRWINSEACSAARIVIIISTSSAATAPTSHRNCATHGIHEGDLGTYEKGVLSNSLDIHDRR